MKANITAFSGKSQGTGPSEAKSGQEAPVSGDADNSFEVRAYKRTKAWLTSPLALALFGLMISIKFYLLTQLGRHKPDRERIMKTIQIEQIVSRVWRMMVPKRYFSASRSVCNSDKAYHGRIELDSHADTTVLGRNCVILAYTGK